MAKQPLIELLIVFLLFLTVTVGVTVGQTPKATPMQPTPTKADPPTKTLGQDDSRDSSTKAPSPGQGTPSGKGSFKRWGLSLHSGISIPHGNFDTFFNPGPNLGIDLEYRITSTFSLEGIYGFHHFRGATIGAVTVGNLNMHQFSFNGKVYVGSSPVRPFFNFGGGVYHFDPSTHGGLNVGAGVQFDVTPTFAVEGVYNFHNVFTSGSNTKFSTLQAGVRFRF